MGLVFGTFSHKVANNGEGVELFTSTINLKRNVIVKGRYIKHRIGLIEFFDHPNVSSKFKLEAAKFFAKEIRKIILMNYGLNEGELK